MATTKTQLVKLHEVDGKLFTSEAVEKGEILVRQSPSVFFVAASAATANCGTCLRNVRHRLIKYPCEGCRAATFCSEECALVHSSHLCSALARIDVAALEGEGADQLRFLLVAYSLAFSSSPYRLPDFFKPPLKGSITFVTPLVHGMAQKLHPIVEKAVGLWPWCKSDKEAAILPIEMTEILLGRYALPRFRNLVPLIGKGGAQAKQRVRGFGVYPIASLIDKRNPANCLRGDFTSDGPSECSTDIYIKARDKIPVNTEVSVEQAEIQWDDSGTPYTRQDTEYVLISLAPTQKILQWLQEFSDDEASDSSTEGTM